MLYLKSNVSSDIDIRYDDQAYPDRATIACDGYRYTVFPADGGMTIGDLEAIKSLPRPSEWCDGAAVRIAKVHDRVLAETYGFSGSDAYFVRVLSSNNKDKIIKAGEYYELESFGWAVEMPTQEPYDPSYYTIWFDAADIGAGDKIQKGEVFVRGFVETTDAELGKTESFHFSANELGDHSNRAKLVDRPWEKLGFSSFDEFSKTPCGDLNIPDETAWNLHYMSEYSEKVEPASNEILDSYRLHTLKSVRLECLDDIKLEVARRVQEKNVPDFLVAQAVASITIDHDEDDVVSMSV